MATTQLPGVALVTGAGGTGIGSAVAHALVSAGCSRIFITDLSPETLSATHASLLTSHSTIKIQSLHGDISSEEFVDCLLATVLETFGRLDYAINCAGILGSSKPSAEETLEDFDHVNAVNYRGLWLCARAEIRAMLKQQPLDSDGKVMEGGLQEGRGSIVHIASQLGLVARPNAPSYSASKAATISLTRSDALDYAAHGIRVNCVCPGVIATPMTTGNKEREAMLAPAVNIAPMKRMGRPSEVAECALFLAGRGSSFVTGHALVVDGGYIIS